MFFKKENQFLVTITFLLLLTLSYLKHFVMWYLSEQFYVVLKSVKNSLNFYVIERHLHIVF